jgi:diketogulonate reductase-like aldo/keto reductase
VKLVAAALPLRRLAQHTVGRRHVHENARCVPVSSRSAIIAPMNRRELLLAATAMAGVSPARPARLERAVPRTGERWSAIGLGTWLTFHIDTGDAGAMAARREVLHSFFAGGGMLIDSSPMYSTAEQVLGELLGDTRAGAPLVAASKVWTPIGAFGDSQMARSLALWRLPRFDLMQVHNLLAWREHLKTLRRWKDEGRTRLLGVTTSHGSKHDEMERVLNTEAHALEFMQITYSPVDRRAEPLMQRAADRGLGVIVNRPFDGGALLRRLAREPLPGLARELGCLTWAALVLKWELAFPAVTCVIPATTRADHVAQNLAAMHGPLPDTGQRAALTALFERLIG